MSTLIKLFIVKKKAKVRNLFKRPLVGLFTLVMVGFYGLMFVPVIQTKGKGPMDALMTSVFVMGLLALVVIICLMVLLQKKQALFFEEDSYYLFIGPFSNRQMLTYSLIDCLFNSVATGLICVVFPTLTIAINAIIPISYMLFGLFIATLVVFIFSIAAQYIYLKEMIHEKVSNTRRIIGCVMILVILSFFAYSYLTSNLDIKESLIRFVLSKEFYFVPVIGWAKCALEGLSSHHLLNFVIGTGSLILAATILSVMTVKTKGYFYEQAMIDATEYSEIYKKAMRGETVESSTKTYRDATVKYRQGEAAILSKNLLLLKKSRALFNKQDLTSLFIVVMLGFMVVPNLIIYGAFVLFYLLNSSGSSSLVEELKVNYIYLIPGKPLKKLINVLLLPILKTMILSILMVSASYFMFSPTLVELLAVISIVISFVLVLYAGDVFSIRFLKSNTTKLLETTLKMVTITMACLPSIGLLWLSYKLTGNLFTHLSLVVPLITGSNVLISSIIFYFCSSMMNANAYSAE